MEEKPVITAGCIFAITCLQGSIICIVAYYFTAAVWCECVSENVRDKDRRMPQFNIQALTNPNNATFRLYIVFKMSGVHEMFHLWICANSL